MKKLRVLEAFSGYGSQSMALQNIGVEHEVVAISEIDSDAIISYGAIRGDLNVDIETNIEYIKEYLMDRNIGYDFKKQKSSIPRMKKEKLYKLYNACVLSNNLGDISKIKVEDIPDHDLFTYSFPCQDISIAGLQKGFGKDGGTRSGLLWECQKIINGKNPKYLLMENVKNLVGKKFKPDFDKWCEWLEEQGYTNYWKVLNAKDYGIPQNRERVFMISILGEHTPYVFPSGFDNGLRLKDILDSEVEEKYYISGDKVDKLLSELKDGKKGCYPNGGEYRSSCALGSREHRTGGWKENVSTLCARDYKDPKVVCIPQPILWGGEQKNQAVKTDGISTCLTSSMGTGGGYVPMVQACLTPDRVEKRQNGRRFKEDGEPAFTITAQDRHGVMTSVRLGGLFDTEESKHQAGSVWDKDGLSPTLDTMQGGHRQPLTIIDDTQGFDGVRTYNEYSPTLRSERSGLKTINQYRIRKLTPKECWRLMGVSDELFERCEKVGVSNSQLYKQAGNSIVVNVLESIFKNLFIENNDSN